MIQINLRDYYPAYQQDMFIEVSEEIATQLRQWERDEQNHQRKRRRYRDYYSLDFTECKPGKAVFAALSPDEYYERKLTRQRLDAAIATLPDKQANRIYAHCVMGISLTKIAAAEGVSYGAVRSSILRGLKRLASYLQKENF